MTKDDTIKQRATSAATGDSMTDESIGPNFTEIIVLAQTITDMMLEAMISSNLDLNWQDVAFAASLSIKAIAEITAETRRSIGKEPGDTLEQVRSLFAEAMTKPILTRRFENKEEMDAWLAEQGVSCEPTPAGPVH